MAKVVYTHTMAQWGLKPHPGFVTLLCSLYLMGAALRLARFNVATETEDSAHDTFLGLPSPAAASTLVSLCIFVFVGRDMLWFTPETADQIGTVMLRGLPGVAAVLGLLMVSHVRYVHVFQRYVKSRMRWTNFVALVIAVWITWFVWEWMLFGLAMLYVLGGLLLWAIAKARGRPVLESLPAPPDDSEAGGERRARGAGQQRRAAPETCPALASWQAARHAADPARPARDAPWLPAGQRSLPQRGGAAGDGAPPRQLLGALLALEAATAAGASNAPRTLTRPLLHGERPRQPGLTCRTRACTSALRARAGRGDRARAGTPCWGARWRAARCPRRQRWGDACAS